MIRNKARLIQPEGAVLPESTPVKLTDNLEDIVTAYDHNGEVVSRASDLIWNLTAYNSHKNKSNLHFVYWDTSRKTIRTEGMSPLRLARIKELQYLMCTILFASHGPDLGVKKLLQYQLSLKKLASYAENHGIGLFEVLADPNHLDKFLRLQSINNFCNLMRMLRFLYTRKSSQVFFEVATLESWQSFLRIEQNYYQSSKQHAPLPTRIYSELISNIDEEINFLQVHLPAALQDLEKVFENWKSGAYRNKGRIKDVPHLCKIMDRYGKTRNLIGVGSVIRDIHTICKLQIHLFSGMRSKEVKYLPFHCLKTTGGNGRNYALLIGETTKLNKGKRLRTQWVTTEETGHLAVKLIQSVSGFIYKTMGIFPSDIDNEKDKYCLFLSTDYLPWSRRSDMDATGITPFGVMNGTLIGDYGNELLANKLIPIIEENDLKELEDIDPFRRWDEESEFQIGTQWPLKAHQLRRSIALYARASGIVRISSLRRQLQHISNDMSSYYSNGSVFAKSFVEQDPKGFKSHVVTEWQNASDEAEILSFLRDVMRSEEPLYGGAGNFYYTQIKNGAPLEREDVEKAVKAGTLAYKSSPIGGCTNPGKCKVSTGLSLANYVCVTEGCKHLVGKHSKLEQIIIAKQGMLNHMDETSVEFKVELEELTALKAVEVEWRSQSSNLDLKGG